MRDPFNFDRIDPPTQEDLQSRLDALREEQASVRQLESHPGFIWLSERLVREIAFKYRSIIGPPEDASSDSKRTYIAGEIKALTEVQSMVTTRLKELEVEIRQLSRDEMEAEGRD